MNQSQRPKIDLDEATRLVVDLFGIEGTAHELPSERDRSFYINKEAPHATYIPYPDHELALKNKTLKSPLRILVTGPSHFL